MNVMVTNVPAVYRTNLYDSLGKEGWKMFFYARQSPGLRYCSEDGPLSFPFEDITLASIFIRLVLLRPKVVVCINASPFTFLCGIYSLLFRKRFVIWWAGTDLSERKTGMLKNIFRKTVFGLADHFLLYSEHAGSYLTRMGVTEDKLTILGNMTFNPAVFRAQVDRERSHISPHPRTLLSVSTLIERKNHQFLLRVFTRLREQFPDLRLIIAGEGPDRPRLEKTIAELGLSGVELRGHVHREEIPALFAEADVFVHPASMDQWPQSVNEAMAAGVPVVVSSRSGVSTKLFTPGEELLVSELDEQKFAEAVTFILENAPQQIHEKAETKVAALFQNSLQLLLHLDKPEELLSKSCLISENRMK